MIDRATFTCSTCFEDNEIDVDWSGARRQEMVEDCAVCCRPNVVRIVLEADGAVTVDATAES